MVWQDDDWCGVHAIARAQQAELFETAGDRCENGRHHQNQRNRDGQVMQDEMGGVMGQIMDDMPLVALM